ncbi:unnamed protein product [Psylliodes chrysocephalus]|uniref:DUF4371 domain-containing protein n=1 Tax=Psylliodes chrysocephalus TaxID=3402493 RepID=A0A9P0DES5_9CUCU|nr:unnamed protein product [Psylliodes chrysocephala]
MMVTVKMYRLFPMTLLTVKTHEEHAFVPEIQNRSADAEDGVHVERGRGSADFCSSDPALWDVSDELREYICAQSSVEQNYCDSDFNESKRLNQIKFAFCLKSDNKDAFSNGFNNWKNANQRVKDHENSFNYKNSLEKQKIRSSLKGRVDVRLAEALELEVHYWREVLKRVVAAVKYLSVKGLALRGSDEHLDKLNSGNFIELLKFLAKFDPFMAERLRQYGDQGSGSTSYNSKTT